MEKVKLMCSYGGKIQQRPHDRQLSYAGGDTKILTVDRSINFSNLLSKLHNLCECNSEFRLKYKLPGQDFDALVSVCDDDDVENMIFEYDLLRRISATPARLRLFVFFPATTPITARSVNPDFLFGFDKEYSFNYAAALVKNPANTNSVVLPTENAGPADGFPVQIQEVQGLDDGSMTRGNYGYPTPLVYRVPVATRGYLQAGQYRGGGNREQPVIYGGKWEQPVVYGFIPVMPSAAQEQPNIPASGSPLSYDATKGEFQHPTVTIAATSNHESKVSPKAPHDA